MGDKIGRARVTFKPENGAYDMFAQVVESKSSSDGFPNTPLQFLGEIKESRGGAHYHIGSTAVDVVLSSGESYCVAYASSVDNAKGDLKVLEELVNYPIEITEEEVLVEDGGSE